ncbi:13699_t:CDS:2 [Dentiscutata heterogama]|uniref:13699_t:CDS:1 n=1 Tax=Dentiscutata heterogama TaxID=1316150 RepID=A0ACA9KH25_9GLOM|nr:13699_t:CDS:2 [Dentiscutata heterogama]
MFNITEEEKKNYVADNIAVDNITANNITADNIIADNIIITLNFKIISIANKYLFSQENIRDSDISKMKGRPSSTKCENTGTKHVTKKIYTYSICKSAEHNSRSCTRR